MSFSSYGKTVFVVFNDGYGGFSLSEEATEMLSDWDQYSRHDAQLVQIVRTLGARANGRRANLQIAEIPKEYENCYEIEEYDGLETVRCYPESLIAYKLQHLDISTLSDEDCRKTLLEYAAILKR